MKYNGIIWTFLFMSQESKKCITSFSSKIFLLGKLSQLTRKKPKVNKQIYFSRWLVSLYAIVCKKPFLRTILIKWNLSKRKSCSYNFVEFLDQFKEDWRKKSPTKMKLIRGAPTLGRVGQGCQFKTKSASQTLIVSFFTGKNILIFPIDPKSVFWNKSNMYWLLEHFIKSNFMSHLQPPSWINSQGKICMPDTSKALWKFEL